MDVLLDEQETLIQETAREFLAAECTPALVRACEKDPCKYSPELWKKTAGLGWLGISLPDQHGGQGLPLTYLGLLLEEMGRHLAPLPMHSTMVAALIIAKYGSEAQRQLLERVVSGELILCYAVQARDGAWSAEGKGLSGRRNGDEVILSGSRSFVDNFRIAQACLVLYQTEAGDVAAALVDTNSPGIKCIDLLPTAKDGEVLVNFDDVRIRATDVIGRPEDGRSLANDLCDYACVLMTAQLAGAARRDLEFAVEYAKLREAFGQPIGAFQAIQHLTADMIIAVDGSQLLAREAIWRISQGLSATIEVSQAKAYASEKCIFVARSSQQIHGGMGFMIEFDLQLWYRRIVSWSLRCGTIREHRRRIARSLLDKPGTVRLGNPLPA